MLHLFWKTWHILSPILWQYFSIKFLRLSSMCLVGWLVGWVLFCFSVPYCIFLLWSPTVIFIFYSFLTEIRLTISESSNWERTFPSAVTWLWRKGKFLLEECGCWPGGVRVGKCFSFNLFSCRDQLLPACCGTAQAPPSLWWQAVYWAKVCPHLPRLPLFLNIKARLNKISPTGDPLFPAFFQTQDCQLLDWDVLSCLGKC